MVLMLYKPVYKPVWFYQLSDSSLNHNWIVWGQSYFQSARMWLHDLTEYSFFFQYKRFSECTPCQVPLMPAFWQVNEGAPHSAHLFPGDTLSPFRHYQRREQDAESLKNGPLRAATGRGDTIRERYLLQIMHASRHVCTTRGGRSSQRERERERGGETEGRRGRLERGHDRREWRRDRSMLPAVSFTVSRSKGTLNRTSSWEVRHSCCNVKHSHLASGANTSNTQIISSFASSSEACINILHL